MSNDRLQFRAWIEIPLEDDAGNKKTYGFYLYYVNVHDAGSGISFDEEILSDTVRDLPISDYEKSQVMSHLILHNDMVSDTFYIYKEPKYIGQCTGIKDSSGRLIYENDLVKDVSEEVEEDMLVVFDEHDAMFAVLSSTTEYSFAHFYSSEDLEIVGNIHEN